MLAGVEGHLLAHGVNTAGPADTAQHVCAPAAYLCTGCARIAIHAALALAHCKQRSPKQPRLWCTQYTVRIPGQRQVEHVLIMTTLGVHTAFQTLVPAQARCAHWP